MSMDGQGEEGQIEGKDEAYTGNNNGDSDRSLYLSDLSV